MIVHLAGAPGSGKTTIAKQVLKPGWVVYDLDDLNRQFVEGNNLMTLTRTNPKQVTTMYQEYIDNLIGSHQSAHQSILFVGINSGVLGAGVGRFMINLHASHKVLLNVDTSQNARLWIQRDLPSAFDTFTNVLKLEVQDYKKLERNETQVIRSYNKWFTEMLRDFRPSQKKAEIIQFKKFYYRSGYTPMIPSRFKEWFGAL